MKTPNGVKQSIRDKTVQIAKEQKALSCCGPTCCGGSNHKINSERKEK